jgi:hypothetical protein
VGEVVVDVELGGGVGGVVFPFAGGPSLKSSTAGVPDSPVANG